MPYISQNDLPEAMDNLPVHNQHKYKKNSRFGLLVLIATVLTTFAILSTADEAKGRLGHERQEIKSKFTLVR